MPVTLSTTNLAFISRLALVAAGIAVLFSSAIASASEPRINVIRNQTSSLNCAAKDMHDEIKTHFHRTKCYGKLLSTNAHIKTRSAAVLRRIDRDPRYRGLNRDIAKLNELTSELSEVYESAMSKSSEGIGRPVAGGTEHVVDKLVGMISMSDRLTAASLVQPVTTEPMPELPQQQIIQVSEIDPNIEIATGVTPDSVQQRLRPSYEQPKALRLEAPAINAATLEAKTPVFRSVLEK